MRTTFCVTLTLFTFIQLSFVPNSFAQDTTSEYVVRVIYFIPNDQDPDPDIDTKLDSLMKEAQKYYADQMEAHGFGRKTFRLETDKTGNVVVHHVKGKYNDTYYQNAATGSWIVWEEVEGQFAGSKNILVLALGISAKFLDGGNIYGLGDGDSLSGKILVPATNPFATFHELGHAFGLQHDARIDAELIFTHRYSDTTTGSFCAAEWLDVNRYFNTPKKAFNQDTNIQLLEATRADSPDAIHLRFKITDPDGLHQAQLFNPISRSGEAYRLYPAVIGCRKLNGTRETLEFITTDLTPENSHISLRVIDKHGNFTTRYFPIDAAILFSPAEIVEIPDVNLAAAVKEALNLPPSAVLTSHTMLDLTYLDAANRQIRDLKGLEYATNMQYLLLGYLDQRKNQIQDITPLAGLKKLKHLFISQDQGTISDITPLARLTNLNALGLSGNEINNIIPLTGLTKLETLVLDNNEITDVTPLVGLVNLRHLDLQHNQISDVTPLTTLTQLEELLIWRNPIKNRDVLRVLSQTNPDVRIFFQFSRDAVPVNLSHFRAERTEVGVILKWTTESEIDNAGFYIYRSETKDGEFKVVNPKLIQGAGTTGERNEYTWIDTTAEPNTVYYYQIEDVSHAGVRKQTATVRLRGLISARGKLSTNWASLKARD